MILAFILIVATISNKKEGFNEFNFNDQGYIPYVSQDVVCMILLGAGVDIDKYGTLVGKCSTSENKKTVEDTSNTCTS